MPKASGSLEKDLELSQTLCDQGDYHTAIFVLRDHPEVREAGLYDLAWILSKDGVISQADVVAFRDDLQRWLDSDE